MNCHSLRTHCPHLNGSIQSESRTVLKTSFFCGSLALVELTANIHSFFPGVEGMYLFKPFHRKDYIVLFPDSAFSLVFSLWISHLILVSAHLLLWSAHLAFPLSFFFPPLVSLLQTHQWPSPPHISLHVRAPVGHVSSAMFHFYSCPKKKKKNTFLNSSITEFIFTTEAEQHVEEACCSWCTPSEWHKTMWYRTNCTDELLQNSGINTVNMRGCIAIHL